MNQATVVKPPISMLDTPSARKAAVALKLSTYGNFCVVCGSPDHRAQKGDQDLCGVYKKVPTKYWNMIRNLNLQLIPERAQDHDESLEGVTDMITNFLSGPNQKEGQSGTVLETMQADSEFNGNWLPDDRLRRDLRDFLNQLCPSGKTV